MKKLSAACCNFMRNSQEYGGDNCATGGSRSRNGCISQTASSSRGVSIPSTGEAASFSCPELILAQMDPIASAKCAPWV